jgi:hypothetical protein
MIYTPMSVCLFPREDECNCDYTYIAGPKKKVILMGTKAHKDFLASIQTNIDTLINTVSVLEKRVTVLARKVAGGGTNAEQAARDLVKTQNDLNEKNIAVEELKTFQVKMKNEWKEPNDRIIGHVVWAPPISVFTPPHGYTKDVCVIKLNKKKFLPNFMGNVIDLGAC